MVFERVFTFAITWEMNGLMIEATWGTLPCSDQVELLILGESPR